MLKALFITLAAVAGWTTVSGQNAAPTEPNSPFPMPLQQAPGAPQIQEAVQVDVPVVLRLQRVAPAQPPNAQEPVKVKTVHLDLQTAPAPIRVGVKAPQVPTVIRGSIRLDGSGSGERAALLAQIESLLEENMRLKNSLKHKRGDAPEALVQGRVLRKHLERELLHTAHEANRAERRALTLQLRSEAKAHRSQAKEQTEHARNLSIEIKRNVKEAQRRATATQKLTQKYLQKYLQTHKANTNVVVDGTNIVHLQSFLENLGQHSELSSGAIEVIVKALEGGLENNLEETFEQLDICVDSLEDVHEVHLGKLDALVDRLELGKLYEFSERSKLVDLADLQELNILDGAAEAFVVRLNGLKTPSKLHPLSELIRLKDLKGLEQIGGLHYLVQESETDCGDEDECCPEVKCCSDDEDCCDVTQECEVSARGFFSIADGKFPHDIRTNDHSNTGHNPNACGTSVIRIEINGEQIYIDTQKGRTKVDSGSSPHTLPRSKNPHRIFFSTDAPQAPTSLRVLSTETPPAPCLPPSDCKAAPSCEVPGKADCGVSMGLPIDLPELNFPHISAPVFAEFLPGTTDFTFASKPRKGDATLVELERMLNEVLSEVAALQVEVDRVRTAVHKNQTR